MPGYYVAHTNREWFDYLSRLGHGLPRQVDEVNFWSPSATRSMKGFHLGEPVFFRLGAPDRAIGGYGFFADFHLLDVHLAWDLFGPKNEATREPHPREAAGVVVPRCWWSRTATTANLLHTSSYLPPIASSPSIILDAATSPSSDDIVGYLRAGYAAGGRR